AGGRAGVWPAVVARAAARVDRHVQAHPARADVVGAGVAVVGTRLALLDGRRDAAARIGLGIGRLAGYARARRGVTTGIDRLETAVPGHAAIVGACFAIVTVQRLADALTRTAAIVDRARVAVVARARLRRVDTATGRVTGVDRARVVVVTAHRHAAEAYP